MAGLQFISRNWAMSRWRFTFLATTFAIAACLRWADGYYGYLWFTYRFREPDPAYPDYGPALQLSKYLTVIGTTLAWGLLIALLLTLSSRNTERPDKRIGFMVLALFLGWDAAGRMMDYSLRFLL